VTEHTPWIANLFRPGEEIVTYSDAQDCVRQLHRLLADPVTVSRIAAAGQQRTLMDHTTARQSERLDAELRMLMSTRR
jgi:spore maturation protein CgeB